MASWFGIAGRFTAVVIATGTLLWCNGTLAAETHAILLRGYLGLFSDGLDKLAQELRSRGINAEVRKHLYWTTAVSDILRERAAGKVGALMLMGHSQGGNDAIEIARALEISHVPVDLLVTFDPYRQKPVPANVARAINYYQSGGWGLALVPETGFRGKLVNNDLAVDATITHFNIDGVAGSTQMSCAKSMPCGTSIRKLSRCPRVGGGDRLAEVFQGMERMPRTHPWTLWFELQVLRRRHQRGPKLRRAVGHHPHAGPIANGSAARPVTIPPRA
jgi:hypothetical protein